MEENLNQLVNKAVSGNKIALESVIVKIKDMVYNLSLKMLFYPDDAQDATQEVLIRIVTHLSTFEGNSQFKTWVYRVATNYLLTEKKKNADTALMTIEDYAHLIDAGQSPYVAHTQNEGELLLLEEEVKVSCTYGLLMCLNKSGRMIYILGDILEFNSTEGSEILGMTSENFRKQLSRSREKIRNFLQAKCGLVNSNTDCRCERKIDFLIDKKKIDPMDILFAHHTKRSIDLVERIHSMDRAVSVFRSVPVMQTPEKVLHEVRNAINALII